MGGAASGVLAPANMGQGPAGGTCAQAEPDVWCQCVPSCREKKRAADLKTAHDECRKRLDAVLKDQRAVVRKVRSFGVLAKDCVAVMLATHARHIKVALLKQLELIMRNCCP